MDTTTKFFVECLEWENLGRDDSYPQAIVTDGDVILTLWQIDTSLDVETFDRKKNIGLHHLALPVATESVLMEELSSTVSAWPGVQIEFEPELGGQGPRKHMMFTEPGGIRIEFT